MTRTPHERPAQPGGTIDDSLDRLRAAEYGYPTGVGCLIARREALERLWRPWFAGGSVYLAGVQGDCHTLAPGEARFEESTPSFLPIPDVESGLSWVNGPGGDAERPGP
jgi:selenocysteine lyase/cysteine desulfurase